MRKKRIKNPNYHGEIPKVTYKEVIKKSRAGVEYVNYVKVFPDFPRGMNHRARRIIKAVSRKAGQDGL